VIQRYQSAQEVLKSVREKLALATISDTTVARQQDVLHSVVEILSRGRGYSWVGIYLAVEDRAGAEGRSAVAQTRLGPASGDVHDTRFPVAKSEIVVPIKAGARTLGMIDAESNRANLLTGQEHALLRQVAAAMAQYLATDRGKLLLRKARERSSSQQVDRQPQKGPQSARPEKSRAAAGEHSTR
jgi:putative methionine-R-sulfoxide reductase with GAF domain